MLDLQAAQVRLMQSQAPCQPGITQASDGFSTAQGIYMKRLDDLRKTHGADGMNLNLRKEWVKP